MNIFQGYRAPGAAAVAGAKPLRKSRKQGFQKAQKI
jgi:hypothetical protein